MLTVAIFMCASWIYFDATSHKIGKVEGQGGFFNLSAGGWATICILFSIVGVPAYLIKRGALIEIAKKNPIDTPNRALKLAALGGFSLLLLVGLVAEEQGGSRNISGIYEQVANDAIEQYGIAKRNGSPSEICVHASLVAAGFLQAKDEVSYKKWKAIEGADCQAAGFPR